MCARFFAQSLHTRAGRTLLSAQNCQKIAPGSTRMRATREGRDMLRVSRDGDSHPASWTPSGPIGRSLTLSASERKRSNMVRSEILEAIEELYTLNRKLSVRSVLAVKSGFLPQPCHNIFKPHPDYYEIPDLFCLWSSPSRASILFAKMPPTNLCVCGKTSTLAVLWVVRWS